MTQVFDGCQSNFYNCLRVAQKNLKHSNPTILQINQISQSLKQATEQLNKMEIQYNLNRSSDIKSKIDLFKEQLRNYKKDLIKIQNKLKQHHSQQYSGPLFQLEDQDKGMNALIQAKRQMYENQQISNQVAVNLKRNNQKLIGGINKIGDINNELTVAHKLLNSIKNKLRKNKLVMWGTIGFLLFILIIVVYSYFRGTSNKTTIVHTTTDNQ